MKLITYLALQPFYITLVCWDEVRELEDKAYNTINGAYWFLLDHT